jgi:acyl-CoA thioesterase
MGGWIRYREPPAAITVAHLLGLVDAWPPTLLPMLSERAPASTLSWFIDFIQPPPSIAPDEWLLYRAEVDHRHDGYGQTSARLWSRDGQLLALSRQTVTIFG